MKFLQSVQSNILFKSIFCFLAMLTVTTMWSAEPIKRHVADLASSYDAVQTAAFEYSLADCAKEEALYKSYLNAKQAYSRASVMMAEETECQTVDACDFDGSQNDFNGSYCENPLTIGATGNAGMEVGVISTGYMIPAGATILSADIQFTAESNSTGAASFRIFGIAEDNAGAFSAADDILTRTKTTAAAAWTPGTWTAGDAGTAQKTTDLTSIVQEIVDRPGYVLGNNIGFVITGRGRRTAESFDTDAASAPVICITYDVPEPPSVACEDCPDLVFASLDGIPNFPTVDLLNVCSIPDTISLLVYNNAECPISNVQVGLTFDEGLSYGGFVDSHYPEGTAGELDVTDPNNPIFLIPSIDSAGVFVINIGVVADCAVDIQSETPLNFDAEVNFSYPDSDGTTGMCSESIEEIGEYNGGVKIPVLNVLSVNPSEAEISTTATPECQTILISQDGLQSNLSDFDFEVVGLNLDFYSVEGLSVNGIVVTDYVIDPLTSILTANIDGQYFAPNFGPGANGDDLFDVNEDLNIEICFSVEGCTDEAMILDYNIYYGCNDEVCGDVTSMNGAVNFKPNFGSTVVATTSNVTYGGICGADLSYDITIESAQQNPLDGLWQDLSVKYNACLGNGMTLSGIQVNGTTVDPSLYSIDGPTLIFDFSTNTNPAYGLTDEDGGVFLNDLVGGTQLTFTTMIDISCSESMAACDGDLACNLTRVEVIGMRNCGQGFQTNQLLDNPVSFFYGEISSTKNTAVTAGYGIPITEVFLTTANVWNPGLEGFEYGYEFGFNNIDACANPGGVRMQVTVVSAGNRINHIRYEEGSATYQNAAVGGVTWMYDTVLLEDGVTTDTVSITIDIPAGDPNAIQNDYYFNLEYEGDCFPNDYVYLTYKVVEECNGCGATDPCDIVRSCGDAAAYILWRGIMCQCFMEADIDTLYRTNYGFADKAMTIPLTSDDVPAVDRQRFVPGDTMYIRSAYIIKDIAELKKSDYLWYLRILSNYSTGDAAKVTLDINHAKFQGWFWKDATNGNEVEIGIPDCFLDYNDGVRDNYSYPTIDMQNFGVEEFNSVYEPNANTPGTGAVNAYGACDNGNINPNYPAESAVNYDMVNMSSSDFNMDEMRMAIFWQRPENCGVSGSQVPGGGDSQDHVNPCFDEFFVQFPMESLDTIFIEVKVPVMHNPAHDLDQLNGTNRPQITNLFPYFNGYSVNESNCATNPIVTSCSSTTPFQAHLPGPVSIVNDVEVTDCDTEVNYTFSLQNPVPTDLAMNELPWYANEYRPFMATEYLEFQFPNNMVYLNDGVIIMPDGSEVPIPTQYIQTDEGNLNCFDDGNGGVCCVAENSSELAALRLVDEQYLEAKTLNYGYGPDGPNESGDYCDIPALKHVPNDPYPHLAIGGPEACTYGIRYNLSSLCPEEIESSDFNLQYQFAEPYIPTLAHQRSNSYYGNIANADGTPYALSYYNMFPINPFGEKCSTDADKGCEYYYQKITTDPDVSTGAVNPMRQTGELGTTPENFEDNSQNFPPLLADVENLLIADEEGTNEQNVYMVCSEDNGEDFATHTNVVTSIIVPVSVDFLGAVDENDAPLTYILVEQTTEYNAYAISSDSLQVGECATIKINTELLFCPVGLDIDTEICLKTTSGCIAPEKAALFSAEGGACDVVGGCYEYIGEEAELQAEWMPANLGEIPLCTTTELMTIVKNVKLANLVDIETMWWFPEGLNFVPGSWKVSYPGGPSNTVAAIDIPDPTPDASQNSPYGTYFEFLDDGIWSGELPGDPVNSMGLPGVGSDADSNFVMFIFEVETECDVFTSGTSIWFQADAADPCESRVQSMFVDSPPIIIENANPINFPQFFVFADPIEANCGVESNMTLTYLNTSPLGETDNTMVCMDIEMNDFDYVPGSVTFISPAGHTPNFTETDNGNITHICFDVPDGIGPGEAFQTGFSFTVPENVSCGAQDLGVAVSSEIMSQECMAQGIECSVNVLNSVNPIIEIDFLPPLTVLEQNLTVGCGNGDGTVPMCYTVDLSNSGPFYSNTVSVALIRDLNFNGQIDDFDTKLDSMDHVVLLNTGESTLLEGCFNIDENLACPVFLMVMQETNCVCDAQDYYYDSIEPEISDELGGDVVLCPDAPLTISNCGDYTYSVVPSGGAEIVETAGGDSLEITLNPGYGVNTPVRFDVTSQVGGCQEFTFSTDLTTLAGFTFGPFDTLAVCNVGCVTLDLEVPSEYEGQVTVEWLPNIYLDDNTSLTPQICDPTGDINYFVNVTFTQGDQVCVFDSRFPIEVEEQPINVLFTQGSLCTTETATFEGPAGFTNYNWIQVADNTETPVQAGSNSTFIATEEGTYLLEYYNIGDVCKSRSGMFDVIGCPVFEKGITSITPTAVANEYLVAYTITVENTSAYTTEYDLYDMPAFDDDIVISSVTYTSDAGPSGGLSLPVPAAPGWEIGADITIDPMSTDTYVVTYTVSMDLASLNGPTPGDGLYTQCGQGSGVENAGPGEALYNNASLDLDDDGTPETEDDACGELPYLIMDKTLISTTPTGGNCYDIVYTIEVENIGGAVGTYDLVDDPGYDDDFTLTTAIYNTTAVGNPGGSLPTSTTLYTLADDQMIQPSVKDSFTLFISVCLDLEDGLNGDDIYSASCGTANDPSNPEPGEGLYNLATLDVNNDNNPDIEDEVCDDVPYFTLTKDQSAATLQADDTYNIVYTITVNNIGGAAGSYNLNDLPSFDDDIDILSASYTSDAGPSNAALSTTVPAAGWELAVDQAIAAFGTDIYTLTVNVDYDFFDGVVADGDDIYTACGDGGSTPGGPGEGLYNEALLDTNDDGTADLTDDECQDLESVDVALIKTVSTAGPYSYGDVVTFDIEVINQGTVTLTDIDVIDYPSCGYSYLGGAGTTWAASGDDYVTTIAGPIAPGETMTVSILYQIVTCTSSTENAYLNVAEVTGMEDESGTDISGDDIDSTPDDIEDNDGGGSVDTDSDDVVDGDGSGTPGDENPDTDEDDQDPAQIEIFDLALVKTLADPGPYTFGEDITFEITVTNQGNVTANNVAVTDYIPNCLSLNDGDWMNNGDGTALYIVPTTLSAGETAVIPITVTVGYCQGEFHVNYAEISAATDEAGDPVTDIDSTPDDSNGNDAGGNPEGSSDDVIDGDGSGTPGDDVAETDEDDHDPEIVQIQVYADIALIKTLGTTQVNPVMNGDAVQFQIQVINQGPIPLNNIEVTDYYPSCLVLNDADWMNNNDGTATIMMSVANGSLSAPLAAGESMFVDIDFVATGCVNGVIENWAEVSEFTGPNGEPLDDIDSTPDNDVNNDSYMNNNDVSGDGSNGGDEDDHDPEQIVITDTEEDVFDLALVKTLAPGQPATVGVGDVVVFQIEVINQGTYNVDNINVVDYIPGCMDLVDGDWTDNGDDTANILLSVANGGLPMALSPGQSVFVTIDLQVLTCNGNTVNWAEINSATDDDGNVWTDVDSTPDNDDSNDTYGNDNEVTGNGNTGGDEDDHDPAEVNVVPVTPGDFDLALTKTLAPGQPNPVEDGDLVTFNVTVLNQGDISADNIEVIDYLPACIALSDTDWTAGANNTATIMLSVANGGLSTPLLPGTSTVVQITTQINGCGVGTETNWAEISGATDSNGDPVTDIDSTPDDMNTDPYGFDDQTDGDGTDDEDDHDPEQIDITTGIVDAFDLALIKILSPGTANTVEYGDIVSFDIQVTNQGNVLADNIDVIDYYPSCLSLMDSDWTDNGGGTASISLSVANGSLTAPLAPGQSTLVSITFEVLPCAETSQVNWAEISGATDGNGNPVTDVDSTPDTTNGNDAGGNPEGDTDNETNGDASGTPGDDNVAGDEDDHDPEVITIMPPVPVYDLALVKVLSLGQPNPVEIGDNVSFDIQVTNQGDTPVDNIEVVDYLPACLTLADTDWMDNGDGTATILLSVANGGLVTPLAPGQSVVVDINVTVESCAVGLNTNFAEISDFTDTDGNSVDDVDSTPDDDPNNDTFGGDDVIDEDGTQGGDEDDHDPETITVIDPTPTDFDLALTKTLAEGQASNVGQGATVTFNVNVTNQGDVAADNVELIDYIPSCAMLADANWTDNGDGTATKILSVANGGLATVLQPGMTITVPVTIVLTDCTSGDVVNYAEIADATDGDGNPVTDIDSTPDDTNGNDAGGVPNGDTNDTVDGDGSGTPGDDTADNDEDDHDPEVVTIDPTIPMDFDLALTKVLSSGQTTPVQNGDMVSFEVTVFNQGDIAADNIEVTDYIPSCMSLNDTDWTAGADNTATIMLSVANGGLATPLLPGTSTMVEITVEVETCSNGTEINWAEISGNTDGAGNDVTDVDSTPDGDQGNDEYMIDNDTSGDGNNGGDEDDHDPAGVPVDDTVTPPGDFDLALIKTLQPGQSSVVMTGDIVDYDIYVINQGEVNADNVVVTDYIPSCFTLADSDWTDNGNGTASITMSVANGLLEGPILPGTSVPVGISLQVGSCSGTSQTNFAEITSATDGDGDPVMDIDSTPDNDPDNDEYGEDDQTDGDGTPGGDEDDHDPETVTVEDELDEVFDLALSKTLPLGAPSTLPINSVVTFNINVFNQGNVAADNIVVTDYLPSCGTLQDADWTDNGDGTASRTLSVANGELGVALAGGQSVTVPITVDFNGCGVGPETNWAEISDATDESGDPVTDIDSTPDSDQGNDTYTTDNDVNGDGENGGDEDDHDPETITFSPVVDEEFDLALIKTLAPGQTSTVSNGDVVVFEITVYNQGNVAADNIKLVDYLPACLTLNDPNWFYDAANHEAVRILSVIDGDLDAPLGPGQNIMVPITVILDGCTDGPIVNYAEIEDATDSDGNDVTDIDSTPDDDNTNDVYTNDNYTGGDGNNGEDEDDSDPEVLDVESDSTPDEFDAALIKVLSPGQTNQVAEGDLISFEIQVTNQGDISMDNIEVIDYFPSCTSLSDPDWADNGNSTASITMSVANGYLSSPLTPGQSVNVQITLLVGACEAGEQTNYAEIEGATDGNGDPVTDVDSTPDNDPDNDTYTTDNETDGDGMNGGDEDDHDPELFDIEAMFDLALQKVVTSAGPYEYGDDVSFGITVYNQGNVPATNIEVTDYVPEGYVFYSADNTGWTEQIDGTLKYTITSLLGLSEEITIPLVLQLVATNGSDTDWDNYAEISEGENEDGEPQEDVDSQMDDFPDNDNDVAPGDDDDNVIDEDGMNGGDEDDHDPAGVDVFDLALNKVTTDEGPFRYGDQVTYTITVYNQGNVPATNVVVNDFIPCGLEYVSSNDGDWSYDGASSIATTTFTGVINPGSFGLVDITLEVTECYGDVSSAWTNVTEIESATDEDGTPQDDVDSDPDNDPNNDGDPDNDEVDGDPNNPDNPDEDDHDPETIDIFDLALQKQLVTQGPYAYGDVLTFNFNVINQGNVDAFDVELSDYIPSGYTFDAGSNPLWTLDGMTDIATRTVATVAAGETVTISIDLTIVESGSGGSDYYNGSEISDADDNDNPDDDDPTDADSDPDNDPNNDNDVTPGDDNDDEVEDTPNDPEDADDDDEDDSDPAGPSFYDLATIKQPAGTGPYAYGDIVDFNFTLINQGTITATNIDIVDYIPCGYIYMSSNDADGWSYDAVSGQATRTIAGPLAPAAIENYTISLQVQPCYEGEATAWTNMTEITGGDDENGDPQDDIDSDPDNDPDNDGDPTDDETNGDPDNPDNPDEDDSDPAVIDIFDLAFIKYIEDKGPYGPGDIAEYKMVVYNQGNIDAYNVEVTDYLNEGYIFDAGINSGWTQTDDLVQTTIEGPIAPGDSIELTLNLEVIVPDGASIASWYNEGEISAADDDLDPNNEDPVDSDSDPDTDPDNDNDLVDGDDDDPIFDEEDDNDNVIDEDPNDPFDNGDDDEDDNDAADILVVGGLGDTVWKDIDGDGIQDANEPGVQGVVVILTDCEGNFIDMELTDSEGFYFFNNLIPGDYQVQFDISGLPEGCAFTYQDQGGSDALDSDVNEFGFAPCTNIQGGEYDSTFDAGLLILASLGDYVWHDLDADGIQESGEPGIEGVTVNLYNEDGDLISTTTTDENGYYLFDNLYPDTYFVEFIDPDGFDSTFSEQGNNDGLDSDITNEVIIQDGGSTTDLYILGPGENNLTIDAGYYMCVPIGETVWYDLDTDNVEDPTENGINGMKVTLWRLHNGVWTEWDDMYTGHKPGTPSDDGYYKFCAPPGTYYLHFKLPPIGLVQAQPNIGSDLLDSDVTNGNGLGTTNSFTVTSGDELCTIGAGYYPMAEVGNFVWEDSNQNGMQESNELPMEGVVVQAYDMTDNMISEVTTDDNGEYHMEYLQQQSYYLKFTPPTGYGVTVANAGDDDMDSDVTHAYGSNTTNAYALNSGVQVMNVDAGMAFGVLPVEWLYVKAENRGDHNLVEWATATEINSDYFEVERRVGNDPSYRTIEKVEAANNSLEVREYEYADSDITESGVYYYRIKQVDIDGRFDYSDIVSVTIEGNVATMNLYPNPAINATMIKVAGAEAEDAKVSVFTKDGKLIRSGLVLDEVSSGNYELRLDVSTFLPGVYTVQIETTQDTWTEKLIVIK